MNEYIYYVGPAETPFFEKREPIVRCKDCALLEPEHEEMTITGGRFIVPDMCKIVRGYVQPINPDGFCAWGVKKGEII